MDVRYETFYSMWRAAAGNAQEELVDTAEP
jgi:hypothetical protein